MNLPLFFPGALFAPTQKYLVEMLKLSFEQERGRVERSGSLRSKTLRYGWNYKPSNKWVASFPDWLTTLASNLAISFVKAPLFDNATLCWYSPGAGIPAHIDAPEFGDPILIVSLGSNARMLFRRNGETRELALNHGSLVALEGEFRTEWTHEILPVAQVRYSIVLRRKI